jgi:predicted TIM-barrel fold metal-dependent hydrolase
MRDDLYIIDTHHHVADRPDDAASGDDELSNRLAMMDRLGTDQAVVIAGHHYLRPRGLADTREVNDMIAAYRERQPDRFLAAVGVVEPLYGPDGLPELDRIADELGLVGVSFHTRFQGVSTSSPHVLKLVERMGELGLIPFIHAIAEVVDEGLVRILEVAQAFPDLTIVVLDAFSSAQQARNAITVAEYAPNLVFDTALARQTESILRFIHLHGAERILYGSDQYSHPPDYHLWSVLNDLLASDLDREQLTAVLSGNVRRVLSVPDTGA